MTLLALLAQGAGPVEPSFPPDERVPPPAYSTSGAGWSWDHPPAGVAVPVYDRALGWYFDTEDVVISWTDGSDVVAWELLDYEGATVASGTAPVSPLNLGRPGPGWYKLYFTRATDTGIPWGTDAGETTFIVSRTGIGTLRDTPVPVGQEGSGWVSSPNRSYIGTGLVRLDVDIKDADRPAWRASLNNAKSDALTALANLPVEPGADAERHVFVQFPDGEATGGANPTAEQQYQITTTVQEMCAIGVTHFEGRNEPVASGITGTQTAAEYAAFSPLVHAADPAAKVVGPCPVNILPIGSGLTWFEDFLAAGGGDYVDVISFHPYNATNNDVNQGRRVYDRFTALLSTYGQSLKPLWMTEYGHYAWVYGSFEPRWQAQVMMTEGHLLWQHGTHRNHVMHYYDFNVGYWAQPMFMWSNDRGRKCPAPLPLMWRTWVEETWGMDLVEQLDFGPVENRHYLGSRFRADDGTECLTVQGSGRVGEVELAVTGAASVTVADYFGRTTALPVTAGRVVVPIGPEPSHVRAPAGVTVAIVPAEYGADVTPVATVSTSGSTGGNGPARAMDGLLQNAYEYGLQAGADDVWMATPGDWLPAWWSADFDGPVAFDTVEIICPPPWQQHGSLLDFDVQVRADGEWVTVHTEVVPTPGRVWASDQASGGCWSDSYWDRRRIFVARLDVPVTATSLRIYARSVSYGGSATIDQARTMRVLDGGLGKKIGQGGPARMTIQEVSLYLSA